MVQHGRAAPRDLGAQLAQTILPLHLCISLPCSTQQVELETTRDARMLVRGGRCVLKGRERACRMVLQASIGMSAMRNRPALKLAASVLRPTLRPLVES